MKRIVYFTDANGVSPGYKPILNAILSKVGIKQTQFTVTSIYKQVAGATKKKQKNSNAVVLNREVKREVEMALHNQVKRLKPDVIAVSCPAILGILAGTRGADTIELGRGGVYDYNGIPCIVVYPITATHRRIDEKIRSEGVDDEVATNIYSVKAGSFILLFDWHRVSRFAHGRQLRVPAFDYSVCRSRDDIDSAERFLAGCKAISIDIETTGNGPSEISCVGYAGVDDVGRVKSYVIPIADRFDSEGIFWNNESDACYALAAIRRINANPAIKIFQNGSYDCAYFIRDCHPVHNYLIDTIHMWHALYPELPKKINFICSMMLDNYQYWKDDIKGLENKDETKRDSSMERYWRYNALDVYYTLLCAWRLIPLLGRSEIFKFNYQQEFMQNLAGIRMAMRGVRADKKRLFEHRVELEHQSRAALARLRKLVDDPEFNPKSPQQLTSLFYDVLQATPRDAKGKVVSARSKKGPSGGKNARKLIKTEHPINRVICDAVEAYLKPDKQISNICDMRLLTSRFRCAFNAAGTETWRYSSKGSNFWDGTNAQNINKHMRDWLIADEGCIQFDIDYSQSDAVFVAYESNDQTYIHTMSSGRDTHAVHAAHFFKLSYEEIVERKKAKDSYIIHEHTGIRPLTKRIVHGANFQMFAGTLFVTMGREAVEAAAEILGYTGVKKWNEKQLVRICDILLREFRALYPRLSERGWYGEIQADLKANAGLLTNAFGMTRKFMGDPKEHSTQREATAFIGQSDTASNMNRSLNELFFGYIPPTFRDGPNPDARAKPLMLDGLNETGLAIQLQVHDSFVGQLNRRAPQWKEQLYNILTVMQRPCIINGHTVRVPVEGEIGSKWCGDYQAIDLSDIHALDRISALNLSSQTAKELAK